MNTKYVLQKIASLFVVAIYVFGVVDPICTLAKSGNTAAVVGVIALAIMAIPVFNNNFKNLLGK